MSPITVACSTLCFRNTPMPAAVRRCGELGFRWIDLGMLENWVHVNPSRLTHEYESTLREVSSACEAAEVRVASLNSAFDQTLGDPSDKEKLFEQTRNLCQFASDLGCEVVTVQTGPQTEGQPFDAAFIAVSANLREMVDIASEFALLMTFEPHLGNLCGEPDRALELVETVPGLKVTYDPSHFIASQTPRDASLPLFQHTVHVHVRDAAPGNMFVPWGTGEVSVSWMLEHLQEVGYQRFISIETIGVEDCPEEVTAIRDVLVAKGCSAR